MKKIIAFAGSKSKNSINKQLITYAAGMFTDEEVTILDLNDFNIPMYSIDTETDNGFPEDAKKFLEIIQSADGVMLSLAEHNGAYTAAFKSLLDWLSRMEKNIWGSKPMLLMATSPGSRGGQFVLEMAGSRMPILGAHIVDTFSLPTFYDNFSKGQITNPELSNKLNDAIAKFKNVL